MVYCYKCINFILIILESSNQLQQQKIYKQNKIKHFPIYISHVIHTENKNNKKKLVSNKDVYSATATTRCNDFVTIMCASVRFVFKAPKCTISNTTEHDVTYTNNINKRKRSSENNTK